MTPTGLATDRLANRLLAHYKPRARGVSVLRIDGVYQSVQYPTQDQCDAASEVYLGGHVYSVSEAVAAALEAAGFTTGADPVVPGVSFTWGSLAGGSWDDFVESRGVWI